MAASSPVAREFIDLRGLGTDVEREVLVIDPSVASTVPLRDLWRYRELFGFLAWRDVLVRYKQTTIGLLWAVVKPLATLVILTVVFGRLAGMPSEGVPYPLLVLTALLPWQFFSSSVADASNSLVANADLVSKVYFPRIIIPVSAVTVSLVDLAVSTVLLCGAMLWFSHLPDWRLLFLPVLLLLLFGLSLGLGLLLSALTAEYRDFRHVVVVALQLALYVSPVGFSSSVVPEAWRLAYYLNPLAALIDGFRWALLRGTTEVYVPGTLVSAAVIGLLLLVGHARFSSTERRLADVI